MEWLTVDQSRGADVSASIPRLAAHQFSSNHAWRDHHWQFFPAQKLCINVVANNGSNVCVTFMAGKYGEHYRPEYINFLRCIAV